MSLPELVLDLVLKLIDAFVDFALGLLAGLFGLAFVLGLGIAGGVADLLFGLALEVFRAFWHFALPTLNNLGQGGDTPAERWSSASWKTLSLPRPVRRRRL